MRKLRLKNDGEGFYHVGSRCVDRTFRFDDDDKTHIVDQMRRMAAFCGMEVNTYSVMTNHFHILLHVDFEGLQQKRSDGLARQKPRPVSRVEASALPDHLFALMIVSVSDANQFSARQEKGSQRSRTTGSRL